MIDGIYVNYSASKLGRMFVALADMTDDDSALAKMLDLGLI